MTQQQRDMLTQIFHQPIGSVPWSWWAHRETDAHVLETAGLIRWNAGWVGGVAYWEITERGREEVRGGS